MDGMFPFLFSNLVAQEMPKGRGEAWQFNFAWDDYRASTFLHVGLIKLECFILCPEEGDEVPLVFWFQYPAGSLGLSDNYCGPKRGSEFDFVCGELTRVSREPCFCSF